VTQESRVVLRFIVYKGSSDQDVLEKTDPAFLSTVNSCARDPLRDAGDSAIYQRIDQKRAAKLLPLVRG